MNDVIDEEVEQSKQSSTENDPVSVRPGALIYSKDKEKQWLQNICGRVKKIQHNRAGFEKQWLVNTAFLYGRHHFDIEKVPTSNDTTDRIVWELRNLQRKKRDKARRSVNYILPLWRSLLSRLIRLKSRIEVVPETESDRDRAAARIGQEVLEDHWQNVNKSNPAMAKRYSGMLKILMRLFNYLTITGRGYLFPYFNASAVAKAIVNGNVMDAYIGAIETKVYSPFDVFQDLSGQFVILQDVMGVDMIEEQYEVEVKPEKISMSESERELQRLLNGDKFDDEPYQDSTRVYTYFHLPTKKHPNGQFAVFAKTKMLVQPTDIPVEYKNRIPIFEFSFLDFMNGEFPQGVIEQLIPSQEEYNYTVERLSGYKKFMAGKLLMPKLSKPEAVWDDEVGQIIKYSVDQGASPQYIQGVGPPVFILREFDRIRRDMEDIAATHDVSLSRVPGGVKSGVAIDSLTEADNGQLAPQLIDIEQSLGFYSETVLDMAQTKYTEKRLIGISGKNMAIDAQIFKGSDLEGNKRVKISLGSSLPASPAARREEIFRMKKEQLISPEKTIELLEFGDVEGLFEDIDVNAERSEIREMAKGVEIIPAEWESHAKRINELTKFMKSEDYKKLPNPIQENFIQHLRWHRIFLQNEMQAASSMTQPQPQPTGGQ